jgi:hypothetical protein
VATDPSDFDTEYVDAQMSKTVGKTEHRQLVEAEAAASVAHDYIWGENGVTQQQASDAIWTIHNALRPLLALMPEPGEARRYPSEATFGRLLDLAEEARLVRAYDQAGGDEWWVAHKRLYAALERAGFEKELDGGD